MARVLITTRIFTSNPAEAALDILRDAGHEPVIASVPGAYLDGQQLHEQLSGIAGTMASSEPYTAETFRMFPELQVVARMGVGYDAIDLEAARDHEVPVMIAAGTNDTTVAESAVALMLALARDLGRYFETTSAGGWVRPPTTELRDKTIGLIGLGRIGRAVVQRLQGFEVDVVAAEPYPDADFVAEHGVESGGYRRGVSSRQTSCRCTRR